jgi:hypothetical protein
VSRRYLLIPDAQLQPGVPSEHIDWAARAIVEYQPDVIVNLGDWWDMHSLSTYDTPGSKSMEGINVKADIDCGNEAFRRLVAPMNKERQRLVIGRRKRWEPECHFLFGNHENRINRAIEKEPKWAGVVSLDMLETPGFQRHEFLKIVEKDAIKFCHFFPNPYTGKAIGGTIVNRLNHIGSSFVQGHQQGFLYASKQYPDHVKHGLVAGRFYLHHEGYRSSDVQNAEWNGLVILNEVRNGSYDLMPLSIDYLRRTFS